MVAFSLKQIFQSAGTFPLSQIQLKIISTGQVMHNKVNKYM